eukprot:4541929-Amphidinium_carterae.1
MTLEDFKRFMTVDPPINSGRSTVRAQSSGSKGDKSKKKPKYADSKKSSRPQESLEHVKILQIEWHGDWWIRVTHDAPQNRLLISGRFRTIIIKEDADVWVEG